MKDQLPPDKHKRIINAHLKSCSIEISATDWRASPEFDPLQGNTFAIFITGDDYNEMEMVFNKLKDGINNSRLLDLHDLPMGIYGQFYGKYGIQWIFVCRQRKI